MKDKKWIQPLISAPFAFILAISSIGNLITGYKLPIDSMLAVYLWCAIGAIAIAVLFQIRHGGKIILGIAAFAVFFLCVIELFRPHVIDELLTLCHRITSHYHNIYNWPTLGEQRTEDVSAPLILWSFLVSFCANWYICRRKHIVVAIVPTVIPLMLCLFTTDRVPHGMYLYLMILALAILFVTDWTRKTQPEQTAKLVLCTVVPVTLFFALLFAWNPKAGYVNHAGRIQKEMSVWMERFQDVATSVINGTPVNVTGDKVRNLRSVGAKSESTRAIMRVNSPISGALYLRERDFDVYTGVAWGSTAERTETFPTGGTSVGTLSISTYDTRNTLLVPYYATVGMVLEGGAVENSDNLQQYRYSLSITVSKKTPKPGAEYTQLPEETQEWAKALADQITAGSTTEKEKILKIMKYVRSSATYNTQTPHMSDSYDDFAQWFLAEGDIGYCIHFASAATVLMRAAGIPARYVEGYIIKNCVPGQNMVVDKQDSHSWVEYYDSVSRAWCILEATPIFSETENPQFVPGAPLGVGGSTGESIEIPDLEGDDILVDIPMDENPEEELPTDPSEPEDTQVPEQLPEEQPVITQPKRGIPKGVIKLIKILLACLFFVLCVFLQGYLRILRKRKLWDRGDPNQRTILRWRQTRSIAKLLNLYHPEELDNLALKARFSQHEMQPEELQKFDDYRWETLDRIAEKPWYQRLYIKWILAID